MIEVIEEKPDPSVKRQVICEKCGVKLEYVPLDIRKTVHVCGSRHYTDAVVVESCIRARCDAPMIIHGGAEGADQIAHGLAKMHGWPVAVYLADWDAHGKAAGPIRNQRMLDEGKPDVVGSNNFNSHPRLSCPSNHVPRPFAASERKRN